VVLTVWLLAAACGVASAQPAAGSEPPLTNANVVALSRMRLGDAVVIAKINQAPVIAFDLSTDGIARLQSRGVSRDVIGAMLARMTPPGQAPPPPPDYATAPAPPGYATTPAAPVDATPPAYATTPAAPAYAPPPSMPAYAQPPAWPAVGLRTREGELPLAGQRGYLSATYVFVAYLSFVNYPGVAARVQTHERRPALIARLNYDPRDPRGGNPAFLVKLDPDRGDNKRSLKIGKGGSFVANGSYGAPDEDWTIPYDAQQEAPGVWRIVPRADLAPGEYGLYVSNLALLYDFGVGE
jgi:hypothetical protein